MNKSSNLLSPCQHQVVPTIENKKEAAKSCKDHHEKETPPTKKIENNKLSSMDINESAEAFIRKFRQQLMIQRHNSIENYEKMLSDEL